MLGELRQKSSIDFERYSNSLKSRAINNYFQSVRRHIYELERLLVAVRGDGKSYIYANYNPKYAQQLLTIFRIVYNFCWKTTVGKFRMTSAQRIGITDKVYEKKYYLFQINMTIPELFIITLPTVLCTT